MQDNQNEAELAQTRKELADAATAVSEGKPVQLNNAGLNLAEVAQEVRHGTKLTDIMKWILGSK